MSNLAVKLFEESEKNAPVREDYLPLLRAKTLLPYVRKENNDG